MPFARGLTMHVHNPRIDSPTKGFVTVQQHGVDYEIEFDLKEGKVVTAVVGNPALAAVCTKVDYTFAYTTAFELMQLHAFPPKDGYRLGWGDQMYLQALKASMLEDAKKDYDRITGGQELVGYGAAENGSHVDVDRKEMIVSAAKLIESRNVERDYGFGGVEAIVEHPKYGRMLIRDGFGGKDSLSGGAVRWRHGAANKLHVGDTFQSLDSGRWNEHVSLMEAVLKGADNTRPIVTELGELALARMAGSLGLNSGAVVQAQKDASGGIFGYYIDLDERGDFVADVRNTEGKTVFEIRAGNSLHEDESSIFEDGFMRDKNDVSGLTEYLRSMEVIPRDAQVLPMQEFEQRLDAADPADDLAPGC